MTQIRAVGFRNPWADAVPPRGVRRRLSAASSRYPASPVTPVTRVRAALTPARAALLQVKERLASAGLRRPRVLRGARTETPYDAPELRTERLLLRPHRRSDAADWFALQSAPEVRAYLPWPERTASQSARHLRDRTRHTRLWQEGDFLALAVVHRGRVVGDVSLHLRAVDPEHRAVEIGWVLHPDSAGAGLATEAAARLVEFAFDTVGAHQVTAVTDARNVRSVALAKRLGFREAPGPVPRHATPEAVLVLTR